MKTIVKMALAVLLIVAAASCKQAPKYALTDGEWAMISWNDDDGEEMMLLSNRPTMKFDAAMAVSGSTGCNNFSGRYTVEKEVITIDMGVMTQKMCLDITVENRMRAVMPAIDRFKIDGNQLILFAGDRERFRFDNQVIETLLEE